MKEGTKNGLFTVISNNFYMMRIFVKHLHFYTLMSLIFSATSAIVRVYRNTVIVKAIIDTVQYDKSIEDILIYILVIMGFTMAQGVVDILFNEIFTPKARQKIRLSLQNELFKKAINMDIACYDNPKFYDDYVFSTSNAIGKIWEGFNSVIVFFTSIVSVTTLFTVIFAVDKIGLGIGTASVLISFIFDTWRNKRIYNRDVDMTIMNRTQAYAGRVFYLPEYAKELRTNPGGVSLTLTKFHDAVNSAKKIIRKHSPQIMVSDSLTYFLATYLTIYGIYCGYLAYQIIVVGTLTCGDFVGMYLAVRLLRNQMMMVTYSAAPNMIKNSLYISKLRKFMNYKSKVTSVPDAPDIPNTPRAITLKNVGFTYDSNHIPTLKNINMIINPYEKIAIVGYNGAGKTTLVKLLMRLYDTSEGDIFLDDINIKDYAVDSYRKSYGTVFQDFKLYAATITDNVVMDTENVDENAVLSSLDKSGLRDKILSLKNGINTSLTKELDNTGVNLSGGESQKVAIARVFYRHYPYIIMDEPSSSLDPISEYNLNKLIAEASKNRTVIYISHRLSATVLADRIYMIENGEIIEQGNHKELMSMNKKYAEMFNIQAQKYINNKGEV